MKSPPSRAVSGPGWPTGHIGWAFSGPPQFEGRATAFLAEGRARNELLMFVTDDPDPRQWPEELLDRGDLVLASTSEVYGVDGVLDVESQRANFEVTLVDALNRGYSGLRVAADNTSLISSPDWLAAWMAWEEEADRFMAVQPVTGLCAFDRTRTAPDHLRAVMAVHSVTPPPGREGNGAARLSGDLA
jgi:hypothetical protein